MFGDPLHANLGLGRVQMATNQPADAEASFRAALAAWDKGAFGLDDQTDARIGLARSLHRARPEEQRGARRARVGRRATTAARPRRATGWPRSANDQGDHDKARAQADKAVELDDSYPEALALDGDLWRGVEQGQGEEGLQEVPRGRADRAPTSRPSSAPCRSSSNASSSDGGVSAGLGDDVLLDRLLARALRLHRAHLGEALARALESRCQSGPGTACRRSGRPCQRQLGDLERALEQPLRARLVERAHAGRVRRHVRQHRSNASSSRAARR